MFSHSLSISVCFSIHRSPFFLVLPFSSLSSSYSSFFISLVLSSHFSIFCFCFSLFFTFLPPLCLFPMFTLSLVYPFPSLSFSSSLPLVPHSLLPFSTSSIFFAFHFSIPTLQSLHQSLSLFPFLPFLLALHPSPCFSLIL